LGRLIDYEHWQKGGGKSEGLKELFFGGREGIREKKSLPEGGKKEGKLGKKRL